MELTKEALEMTKESKDTPWAKNTRISYERHFGQFEAWCHKHGTSPLPAHPNAIVNYLAHLVKEGKSRSYLKITRNAIRGFHHKHCEGPNPVKDPSITEYLESAYASAKNEPRGQALPLRSEDVDYVCDYLDAEIQDATTFLTRDRWLRKKALFRVMSDAALRRSEAVALEWTDVTFKTNGTGEVRIKQSKTSDKPEDVPVGKKAVEALKALRKYGAQRDTVDGDPTVFGMKTGHGVTMWIRKTCAVAGLMAPPGRYYSGHSLRVGRAVECAERGASTLEVRAVLRHRTDDMAALYSEQAMSTHVLDKYFNNE